MMTDAMRCTALLCMYATHLSSYCMILIDTCVLFNGLQTR
jgi:hypothetical protein